MEQNELCVLFSNPYMYVQHIAGISKQCYILSKKLF